MARIFDNIGDNTFEDGLHLLMDPHSGIKRVDFCTGYFNLRGWGLVASEIDKLEGDFVDEEGDILRPYRYCRLLIGMHQPPQELARMLYGRKKQSIDSSEIQKYKARIARDFRQQLTIGQPSDRDKVNLNILLRQLQEGKVCVKLHLKHPLHAKLYIGYAPENRQNPHFGLMGSSNLTYSGLTRNGELNAEFKETDQMERFVNWFNDRWNNDYTIDITNDLIQILQESWACNKTITPYHIYLKTAYVLSEEARNGINAFAIPPIFKRELFPFQQIAVQTAARYLSNDKRGGAMIGDVVGLGKTITACAIAKIYENAYGTSTLVICPANLTEMWEKYKEKYDLKIDIVSMSKPIDAESSKFYRLIIIDESHNLRNGASGQRYQRIKKLIEYQGSNVLLLTATPYNKNYMDISNQLRLFISDDKDLGIRPEQYIEELGGDMGFMRTHNDTHIRSLAAFDKSSYAEDWNELMRMFLIRRTRTFVKKYYAETDLKNGRKYLQFANGHKSYFPERIPKAKKFEIVEGDQFSKLYSKEMIDLMFSLSLPRYGLTPYVNEKKAEEATRNEKEILENLSRAGNRQMGFCKATFFKRMDSSGFAFLLTLSRHILRNMVFVHAIENKYPLPIADENQLPEDFLEDQDPNNIGNEASGSNGLPVIFTKLEDYKQKAKEYYVSIASKSNVDFLDSKYFKKTLKKALLDDCETLLEMIRLCGVWRPDEDKKIEELLSLLQTTHKDEKVIIFTQYSDTAKYIYHELKRRGLSNLDIVTGDSKNPTAQVEKFSPVSNGRNDIPLDQQTRVMVATDVLSEGQNLQDAHIVFNYDLPWAIIRMIQRAGRVDRIGQEAQEVFCYSFFPADGIEKIISIRERLNKRINENAKFIGSDEVFFEGNEQNLRDLFNEKAGALDEQEDENDVDLPSMAYQIWKNATDADPSLKSIVPQIPNWAFTAKKADNPANEGVITLTHTSTGFDILSWLDKDGNTISTSQKKILQALQCNALTPAVKELENHQELVAEAVAKAEDENQDINTVGVLGSRFSVRSKIIRLLEEYNEQNRDNVFVDRQTHDEISLAIENLYYYSILDSAKRTLNQMLRRNMSDEDIVQYVLDLRKSNTLCHIPNDENDSHDPEVICSMGLVNNPEN